MVLLSDTLANRFLADVQLIASAKEEQISEGRKVRKEGRKEGRKKGGQQRKKRVLSLVVFS
jgi:hypothetical protein